ncbi:hypothetical protein [Pseudoteredinibacter isoporae]|uniref:hypothetical protein n=1 Tax=Pseudoteredinibacter isoporae TaxID=570281 RepID=UPI0031089BA8
MKVLTLDKSLKKYLRDVVPKSVFKEIEQGKANVVLVSPTLIAVFRMELSTMVIVGIKGRKVYESRQALIDLARANGASHVRFHTKYPERLQKAMAGLEVKLVGIRRNLLGRDEHIYLVGVM